MEYPELLLPSTNHRYIRDVGPNRHLLRRTDSEDIKHPSTGLLKDEVITGIGGDKLLLNYSINLMGQFRVEHLQFSIEGERKKYFTSIWVEGTKVERPVFERDFQCIDGYGCFCIPVDAIHLKLKVPYKKGMPEQPFEAMATVEHVPTNCNFWHFEIRWKDSNGNPIKPGSSPLWRKNLASSIKAAIRQYCRVEIPDQCVDIEPKRYLKD